MRLLRHLIVVLGALLLLSGGVSATAQPTAPASAAADRADTPAAGRPPSCPTTDRVGGTNRPPDPPLQEYYLDDWRLGPEKLPRSGAIGRMLKGYERLDDLTADRFLACYWNEETSGWWYPDPDGWVLVGGKPLKVSVELQAGQKVDLFGSGFGRFLAPAGTPYAKRALPPSNLNTLDPRYPFGYHLYEVVRPFTVEAGPIRPWFGQPGYGLQYKTGPAIPDLVRDGYLRPLN